MVFHVCTDGRCLQRWKWLCFQNSSWCCIRDDNDRRPGCSTELQASSSLLQIHTD